MMTVLDPPITEDTSEQRILLEGVSWERFEQLSACFVDTRSPRLTYIDGSLEMMSPVGEQHETYKRNISYLLGTYLDRKEIRFYGRGSFTLKMPQRAAGEPDESYCIGSDKALPDLVIEVVVTEDALSKLPLFQALSIPEVWIWRRDELEVHVLEQAGYQRSPASRLLPHVDLGLLAAHARMPDQYDAVRAVRRSIE